MEPFRLRLKFDDSVLSDSQKSDGLTRSWFLVQPEHRTISDLLTCLLRAFNLSDSCPHGVFLSVEGFALPHFESIAILDNTDLVCVKRKDSKLCLEQKADKKLPFDLGKAVLENGDCEKEVAEIQNVCEEEDKDIQTDLLEEDNIPNGDASIKKRKASKQLKNSKKKRKCKKQNMSSQNDHSDSFLQNQRCSNVDNWEGIVSLSSEPDETVRASTSRATRRKGTQRKRRRPAQPNQISQGKDLDEGEIITPAVVQPRHIRFGSPEKGKEIQQDQGTEELPNWREITNYINKKKWGKEKESASNQKQQTSKWNEIRSPQEKQSTSTWGGSKSNGWNEYRNRGRNWNTKKAQPIDPLKEYEKLLPLTDFPLEGDMIAYRLLDISSSLCPVMTSYRVGKVASCEPKTNMVTLVPVPEYPFEYKKASDDTCNEPADASRYKEDGSLEIDFPSLADVRVLRRGPSASGWKCNNSGWGPTASESSWVRENVEGGVKAAAVGSSCDNGEEEEGGGGRDVWEEIIAAVRAKEAEEAKEDNWNKKRERVNYTWIYRTVRRQPPNMRARNGNGNGGGQG